MLGQKSHESPSTPAESEEATIGTVILSIAHAVKRDLTSNTIYSLRLSRETWLPKRLYRLLNTAYSELHA